MRRERKIKKDLQKLAARAAKQYRKMESTWQRLEGRVARHHAAAVVVVPEAAKIEAKEIKAK
jgi:hypothetical protein